jgi:hypothetical protein
LEYVVKVKIVSFSIALIRRAWSKLSVSALLEYVIVKIVGSSLAGMCHGQNLQIQHAACLKYVMVKIVHFSMAGMYCGRKGQF